MKLLRDMVEMATNSKHLNGIKGLSDDQLVSLASQELKWWEYELWSRPFFKMDLGKVFKVQSGDGYGSFPPIHFSASDEKHDGYWGLITTSALIES